MVSFQQYFPPVADLYVAEAVARSGANALVVDDCLELERAHPIARGWSPSNIHIQMRGTFRTLDDRFRELRDNWRSEHPDEESHSKMSMHDFRVSAMDGRVRISVEETEWAEVQPIHSALRSPNGNILYAQLFPCIADLASCPIPNIMVVHGVIETGDNMLVLTQRGKMASYSPGHWSASFEEQVEPSDLEQGGAVFHIAAARGIDEEFSFTGIDTYRDCRVLSLCMDLGILNPAAVAYVKLPCSSTELAEAFRRVPNARNEFEPESVHFVRFEPDPLSRLVLSENCDLGNGYTGTAWHPTSRYRLLLAMMHRFGEHDTFVALNKQAANIGSPGQECEGRRSPA